MSRLPVLIAVLVVACVLSEGLLSANTPKVKDYPADNAALRIVMAMAGQFRIVFANLLWIKVDQYHHEHIKHHSDWAQDTDLLPLLRMITWLDPHFVQAYQVAGFMLSARLHRYEHARQLLEEGIRNNPKSYELYEETGMAIIRARKDYREAYTYLTRALSLVSDEFDRQRLDRFCATVRRKMEEENHTHQTK
ncbi:MAG: hypothetical protein RMM08_05560 [Armatimonadota bacterium]|nr:hypothetical protein [bacterium]MDW8320809.1 hypothetical protein [Armatimonadota bacterium]